MDRLKSVIRVSVAVVVGWVVAQLASVGIEVSQEAQDLLSLHLQAIVSIVYYVAVRTIAAKWPLAELFLLIPSSPVLVDAGNEREAKKVLVEKRLCK